jgi:hypothetical protein
MSNASDGKPTRSRRWQIAILALGSTTLLAACGTSASSNTPGSSASPSARATVSPTSSPSISCAQITSLRTSLANLSHAAVTAKSDSQVSADLTSLETTITAIKNQTTPVVAAAASQLTAALSKISKDVRYLVQHPSPASLNATTTAVKDLKATAQPIIDLMETVCASS